MSDDGKDADYEEASPEQKLSIATYFIMSSPVGEVDFVKADTEKLVDNKTILSPSALLKILKDYNIEQMTAVPIPEKKTKTLITSYGMVTDNEFIDPREGKVWIFDHMRREFTGTSEVKLNTPDKFEEQRKAIQGCMDSYIEEKYKPGKAVCCVYCTEEGGIVVCITASNTKISSYWTGGWNAVYQFSIAKPGKTIELNGNIKIHVHYFEDGNVQLHAAIEKKTTIVVGEADATGKSVKKAILTIEEAYQSSLAEMYVDLHRSTFKDMRRFLPITRQPMEWNQNAHGVGMGK